MAEEQGNEPKGSSTGTLSLARLPVRRIVQAILGIVIIAGIAYGSWKTLTLPEGERYTCWKRDEYTLDLWVREPACADDPLRNRPTVAPTEPGAGNPAAPPPCAGSVVSIKVRNAIADDRGRPQETQDPDFTGEDPDPIFTDDPLLEPTPLRS